MWNIHETLLNLSNFWLCKLVPGGTYRTGYYVICNYGVMDTEWLRCFHCHTLVIVWGMCLVVHYIKLFFGDHNWLSCFLKMFCAFLFFCKHIWWIWRIRWHRRRCDVICFVVIVVIERIDFGDEWMKNDLCIIIEWFEWVGDRSWFFPCTMCVTFGRCHTASVIQLKYFEVVWVIGFWWCIVSIVVLSDGFVGESGGDCSV